VAASLSAIGSDTPAASATATLKIAAGVLMFVVIEQLLIQRREFARDLATAFAVSLVLPGIAAVAQMFTGSGFGDELGLNRLRGTFVHPNPFATYLVMLLLFSLAIFPSLAGARRWLLLATAATSGVLLVLTYTRAAWIAAVAGMAFLAWKQRPKLLWLIPAGVLLLLVLAPSILQRFSDLGTPDPVPGYPANSAGWRAAYWQELLPEGIKSPVTGLGIDSVRLTSADGRMPHNLFVQSWVEMGLLGLFAALTVIVVTVIFTRRRLRAAEPGPDRALALAAAAVGLSLLVQMPSENLLTQGIVYWYGAVSLTIGYERRQVRRPLQMPVRP
jgi:O-antigen ligase